MKIEIDEAELDELRQKAQAWDDHVMSRLKDGYVRQNIKVEFVRISDGAIKIVMHDPVIISPFGEFQNKVWDQSGKREFRLMHINDQLTLVLEAETKLSIN